jgi:hypothetical protein
MIRGKCAGFRAKMVEVSGQLLISPTQNGWDFLSVLAEAIRHYGAPEALVTDGGGQFYSAQALQLYDMLGIRKERIEPGEPWQNYVRRVGGFGIPAQCRGG